MKENSSIYKEEKTERATVTVQREGTLCERERKARDEEEERGREANVRTAKEKAQALGEVPACCRTCGNYQPQFFSVSHKECAAFGTIKGVKWDRCGAWTKRVIAPGY